MTSRDTTLSGPIAEELVALGLTPLQADLYDALLAGHRLTPTELAESIGAPADQAVEALEELAAIGLVGGIEAGRRVKPLPPESAVELLIRRREVEVRRASAATLRAFAGYRRMADTDGSRGLLEVVRGEAVLERVRMLERSARHQVRTLDCPPYHSGPGPNEAELANLERGVSCRVVYASEAVSIPAYVERNIRPALAAGERARVLLHVPVKLMVIDDSMAIVALTAAESDVVHSALILRKCSLLSALVGLWDMCWRAAIPLQLDGSPAETALEPAEARFLRLLSAGISDEQVATMLGISRRTFFRYLEQMMARTGTVSRFQLATYACRQGWIQ